VPQIGASSRWIGIWSEITTGMKPSPRATHSAVWDSHSSQMIVFGGNTYDSYGGTIGLKDVWMYDPASNVWSQGSDASTIRGAHVAVWDTQNNQMIVHGGEAYYGSYNYYKDTWTYDPIADTWTQKTDGPTVRAWATGVWDSKHNQMIVFGGYYRPINDGVQDTWVYLPSTDSWVRKADGPSARWAHMAVWNSRDDVMIVFGGVSQSGWYTDTWVYDPDQDQWYQKADIPSTLAQASAVWDPIHEVVIVFGGEKLQDHSNVGTDETWIYDPTLDIWIVLDTETQPSVRGWLQAVHVWDSLNNQMILFGGNGAVTGFLNDLWVFKIQVQSTVDIDPNTLNLKSKGKLITAYIELPEGYDVADIDVSSIILNATISVDSDAPTAIGDFDSDGVPDLMVKFNRAEVISYILDNIEMEDKFGTITLTVSGYLNDGTPFEGTDTIKIIYNERLVTQMLKYEKYLQSL
jgi:hypothetical protein